MDYTIQEFEKINDSRGELVVFLKSDELDERDREFGQIYFVTFEGENQIRGEHYHKHWREWFGVVSGKILVRLKDVRSGEKKEIIIDADHSKYVRLETGPYVVHGFKSISEYAAMINYANGMWSENDTFAHPLFNEEWNEE